MGHSDKFAKRTKFMQGSIIREILKAASKPEIVSLAGGLPAPETFPTLETITTINNSIYEKYGPEIFQYAITEGFIPFREEIQKRLEGIGIDTKVDDIRITTGSQQVIDLLCKALLNPGDRIAVENPTYLGALISFNPFEPDYVKIESDEMGAIPESLETLAKDSSIKFFYLIPNFQNPTGRTMPLERRKKIAEIAIKYNLVIYEDDPYRDIRFDGEHLATIKSMAPENVIYAGSFSKIFAPGLRLGYFVAPEDIAQMMHVAKQGADLHTNIYAQAQASEYLKGGFLDQQLPKSIAFYKARKNAMVESLEKYFPADFKIHNADGGMFIWVEGPQGFDAEEFYWKAIEQNVAFVPGKYFFVNHEEGAHTMRLNFSNVDEETITNAVKTLGQILKS